MRFATIFVTAMLVGLTSMACAAEATGEGLPEFRPTVSPAFIKLVVQVLDEHPGIQAARAILDATQARGRAADRPLYNPALELDAERAETDSAFVGISQSIDWADKRGARTDISVLAVQSEQAGLALVRQEIIVELLATLNAYYIARETVQLVGRRVELMEEFFSLAEQRFNAGDIARTDVDLARLALSEARMQSARFASESAAANANLGALVLNRPLQWPTFPSLPAELESTDSGALLVQHPRLRQLRARTDAARANVELAQRERRPDPTLGVRGGKEESETLIGLTISIPLFVRNNFRAEVEAASAEVLRDEQVYRDAYRRARSSLEAASTRYRLTHEALSDWQRDGQASLQDRGELLKQLWEAGEISTTVYLVQLQQTLDTQFSAAELNGATKAALVDWLDASGSAEAWLGLGDTP